MLVTVKVMNGYKRIKERMADGIWSRRKGEPGIPDRI